METTRTLTSLRGSRQASAGFSLFEILVVLVLFALVAALVIPSFSVGLRGLELETTARDLITRMKQARSESVSSQKVFRIVLAKDEETSYYLLTNDYEEELKRFDLPKGVTFVTEPVTESVKVSFYPNGRSSGSLFLLRNEAGKQVNILVDAVTGFPKVIRPEEEGS